MPTKRRKIAPRSVARVTEAAIVAWQAGDYWGLHHELGLRLWEMPDWGFEPPMEPPPDWPACIEGYEHVCAMQKQLMEVAGPPPKRWFYRHADQTKKGGQGRPKLVFNSCDDV